MKQRLDKLRKFNKNNNDNKNNDIGPNLSSPPSALDDDNGNFPSLLPINVFLPYRIQQPNFIPNLSSPSSPDLDDNSLNQVLYPNTFDHVLGELVVERLDDIKLSENLQDLFPEAHQILKDDKVEDKIRNEVLLPNIEKILKGLNEGKTLVQL